MGEEVLILMGSDILMPWQPDCIIDTQIVYRSRGNHTYYQSVSYYLVLDQVIATARRCHGSQSVSWLIFKITPTRPGAPGFPGIARGGAY